MLQIFYYISSILFYLQVLVLNARPLSDFEGHVFLGSTHSRLKPMRDTNQKRTRSLMISRSTTSEHLRRQGRKQHETKQWTREIITNTIKAN